MPCISGAYMPGCGNNRTFATVFPTDAHTLRIWVHHPMTLDLPAEAPVVCSAGLEFRDYPTLVKAVDGLDVRVVIGAASHWSKRHNSAEDAARPAAVA